MARKPKSSPTKQASGGARLIASGKRPVTLGVPPDDHAILAEAAKLDGRPLTQFVLHYALAAAKKKLEKSGE